MSNTGHILIIDDEAALRQTLARILQQAGFEVTTAENGEQGLSFIQTTNFDLIFMDLRMPGIAGHGCAQAHPRKPPKFTGHFIHSPT